VEGVTFKDDALAFVELEMKPAGVVDFGAELRNPIFARIAGAAWLLGLTTETPDQWR